jgi:hypothetical protein
MQLGRGDREPISECLLDRIREENYTIKSSITNTSVGKMSEF